jgi:hypothetical protein
MLLPAILAPEGAPHHLRLLGTLVPTYIFVALGFTSALNLLNKFLRSIIGTTQHATRLSYLLPATCYLLLAFQTSTNYFSRWHNSVDFTLPFELYAVRLAADISHTPPEAGYVIPMDIRAGAEARHYTLDYILGSSFSSLSKPKSLISNLQLPREATNYPAYTYLPVDKHQAETLLSQAAKGKNELRVVRWTEDKHREADTKEIVTYLLETNTQFLGRESFRVYDLETYKLASQPTFTLPPINQSLGLDFEGLLRLDAAFVPSENKAGGWLPVALTFAPLAPMAADYKASLRLIGPSGERIAQKDRTLRHNFHQGTSLWPPETVNEYYLLPLPPETPSGNYTVTLVIYHPDTLAPLISEGVDEVPVGSVHLNYTEQQQKITKIKIEKGEKEQ